MSGRAGKAAQRRPHRHPTVWSKPARAKEPSHAQPLFRAAAPAAALIVSLATAAAGTAAAAHPAQAAGGRAPLVLLTGDRVAGGPGLVAGHTVSVLSASGRGVLTSSLMTLGLGARTYLVPAAALPYLGRGLDASLFEVAALRAAGRADWLPVTLRYHGRPSALPGVTITHAAARTAGGYLTGASAARFQWPFPLDG